MIKSRGMGRALPLKHKKKLKKVIKGLKKASKLHAKQAKTLKGVIRGTRASTK